MSDMSARFKGSSSPAMIVWLTRTIAGTLTLALFAIPLVTSNDASAWSAAGGIRGRVATLGRAASADVSIDEVKLDRARVPATEYRGVDGQRITPARIRRFLDRHKSPMARYSAQIVEAGIRYRVDPRVVVAISGVESTYGQYAFGYNAWGWGRLRWNSWPESIDGYTRAVSAEYRSLRTGRFAAASRTYCPPCGKTWGIKALRIFRDI